MSVRNARFATLCLLLIMFPVCALHAQSDSEVSPDAFAKAWTAAWNSHDVDRILAFYTRDAFYEDVPSVENGWDVPMRGHQMIRESLVETFEDMSDLSFELVSAFGAGDHLVVEWTMTGSQYREFAGRFSTRAVSIIRLEGNRIAWERDYYDMYQSLIRLGMVPALGAEQPFGGGGDDDG